MLVAIGLVYLILVILFASLLVPLVIFFPLPLTIIGAFVVVVTGGGLDLSALIATLISIVVTNVIVLRDLAVVTNAIVLRDLMQHGIEVGADVRAVLIQGGRTRVRPILVTAPRPLLAPFRQLSACVRPTRAHRSHSNQSSNR